MPQQDKNSPNAENERHLSNETSALPDSVTTSVPWHRRMSTRLGMWGGLYIGLAMILIMGLSGIQSGNDMNDRENAQAQTVLKMLQVGLRAPVQQGDKETIRQTLFELANAFEDLNFVAIRDVDGNNLARWENTDKPLNSENEPITASIEIRAQDQNKKLGTVEIATSTQSLDAALLNQIKTNILACLIAALIGALFIMRLTARFLRPLRPTVAVLEGLARGNLKRRLNTDREDEVGQMAMSLNRALEDIEGTVVAISKNALLLGNSSEKLSLLSHQMEGNAGEASNRANLVSTAAQTVSRNVQTVASGAEEMSISITEIAKSAHDAARVATQAVRMADETNANISRLSQSSQEIGKVVGVIMSIAEQTNLLALNASIEAARAGDAGKGFGVVANQVKELARETAAATDDIQTNIRAIQSDTQGAVEAIAQISNIIKQVNDIQNTIAIAVEEQTATSRAMGESLADAARGSSEIADNINGLAEASSGTAAGVENTILAAHELARVSKQLQHLVNQFTY
ncbi:MAG TPA: methyl-accepting chemotaxis protein [Myxococcales bacterium]|nr:methyl-accepting chemotaxis protein [Myxococcales bacterium]HIN86691.1 methyl-accepting chemotaxis protein [Myxococcales bacterium]